MTLEGNNQAQPVGDIESLRCILESQRSRSVTVEEASEIGEDLLSFFTALGESSDPQNEQPASGRLTESESLHG